MKKIFIVYRKELLDVLRDKRTLRTTILIPTLLMPFILFVIIKVQVLVGEHNDQKVMRLFWLNDNKGNVLEKSLQNDSMIKIKYCNNIQQIKDSIKAEKADAGLFTSADFSSRMDSNLTSKVSIFYNSKDDVFKNRLISKLEIIKMPLVQQRLVRLNLSEEKITPFKIEEHDIASTQEMFGKYFGGFLPYIFILYSFMGCMMLTVDLFTGEKERGTIETLLTSPVNRLQIMFGKIGVAVTGATLTAILSISGILLFVKLFGSSDIPVEMIKVIGQIFTPIFIAKVIIMLLPLTVFFSGILVPVATYAKNYREATSIIAPFNFLVIFPAMIAMMPGVKLNLITSLIPITNVALCTKNMVAGDNVGIYWWLTFASLLVYGSLAVIFSYRQFSDEQNILR